MHDILRRPVETGAFLGMTLNRAARHILRVVRSNCAATVAALTATAILSAPAMAQTNYCATYSLPAGFGSPATNQPMHYQVRDTGNGRVLIATGSIKVGEASRLAQALRNAGAVDEVWLNSGGGVLVEGLAMGRVLRKAGVMTRVPNGAFCASACTFVFLGGPVRIIDPNAYYGVHAFSSYFQAEGIAAHISRISNFLKTNNIAELQKYLMQEERINAQLAAECAKFLVEMSASLEFLTGTFGQAQLGMCYLSRAGMTRYNVVNAQ